MVKERHNLIHHERNVAYHDLLTVSSQGAFWCVAKSSVHPRTAARTGQLGRALESVLVDVRIDFTVSSGSSATNVS